MGQNLIPPQAAGHRGTDHAASLPLPKEERIKEYERRHLVWQSKARAISNWIPLCMYLPLRFGLVPLPDTVFSVINRWALVGILVLPCMYSVIAWQVYAWRDLLARWDAGVSIMDADKGIPRLDGVDFKGGFKLLGRVILRLEVPLGVFYLIDLVRYLLR